MMHPAEIMRVACVWSAVTCHRFGLARSAAGLWRPTIFLRDRSQACRPARLRRKPKRWQVTALHTQAPCLTPSDCYDTSAVPFVRLIASRVAFFFSARSASLRGGGREPPVRPGPGGGWCLRASRNPLIYLCSSAVICLFWLRLGCAGPLQYQPWKSLCSARIFGNRFAFTGRSPLPVILSEAKNLRGGGVRDKRWAGACRASWSLPAS